MDIVTLPSLLAIPNSFGAPPSPLAPGQIVDAIVLAVLENGIARLQLPDSVVDVRTAIPLTPGARVRLAVTSTASGLQLVVLTDANAPGRPTSIPAALVGRGQPAPDAAPRTAVGATPNTTVEAPAVEIAVSGGTTAASAKVAPATTAPTEPAAPTDALGEAVRVAAARQGGLAPLLADLEQAVIAGAPALPARVAGAAARVLDFRVPLDQNLSAADVKHALVRSGLFLEARLAKPEPGSVPASATAPADLKAALLVFRQVVRLWLGGEGAAATAKVPLTPTASLPIDPPIVATPTSTTATGRTNAAAAVPPPYRGAPPTAQAPAPPTLPLDAPPRVAGERLLAETDAALARHTLLQVASLPDAGGAAGPRATQQGAQWAFEIPFATGQGTGIAQFEISRDGRATAAEGRTIWRARFSLDVEPMGPVHALVAVLGERAAVTLWAEREASAARLRDSTAMLADALKEAELEPGDIQFRVGAPVAPRQAAGRFLDRAS